MHFLMTAMGSYGDVHPIVGLGATLLQRGHRVTIIANPHFRSVVESVGAELVPLGTAEEYAELAANPNLWHPVRGLMLVLRKGLIGYLRELYALIESNYQPGETVLVAHPLDMASRIFQEKYDAPLANAILAPVTFRSFYQSPKMHGMLTDDWVPHWFRRLQFWLGDVCFLDPMLAPEINKLRKDVGLQPPVKGIFRDWFLSPQLVLGLFPDWFAPTQPDWPSQLQLTGFPLWDQPNTAGLSDEVQTFLNAGDPPIVFTPGSAMAHGQKFFAAAVEACQRLGRRGMLLTKYPEQLPADLPVNVQHFSFVSFSQLLPHSAAFVHHGGIGSCSQGLAAGVPQLIMPMAFDQPDNAHRLKTLGVAESLSPAKFRGPAVAAALDRLLTTEKVRERCQHWATQCDGTTALTRTCEQLEGLQ